MSGAGATIVSLLPFRFFQEAPGLYPVSQFFAEAAKKGEMEIIHVEPGWFNVYVDHERGNIRVNQSAEAIAEAITNDAKASKPYGVVPGQAEPGIFMLPGKLTKEQITKNHKDVLDARRALQDAWFLNLIAEADDLWNKYKSHRMISDTCRLAAKMLGQDREWNIETTVENQTTCPACTTKVPTRAVVCPSCRCILDEAKFKNLKFAEV